MDRRSFLGSAALGGSAVLASLAARLAGGQGLRRGGSRADYGPLRPLPDRRDGVERLALPEGFHYRSFGWEGDRMSDGRLTPRAHDGMAAFPMPNGNIRLVRNHEDRDRPPLGVLKGDPALAWDPLAGGGTTTLEVRLTRTGDRALVRDFLSLGGTFTNCAGGPTPWGSWITCEETTDGPSRGFLKNHGYVFEVPAAANTQVAAIPLPFLGRLVHEALAVDPRTGIVYLTEDANAAGFYRYVPRRPGHLAQGGRLQMMAIDGLPNYDTRTGQPGGLRLDVTWVDIGAADPPSGAPSVYEQGAAAGGAAFQRLEGCWWGRRSVFFISTDGGDAGLGQVWEYEPRRHGGGQLRLVFESTSAELLSGPDNVTVSPGGGIVLCEDGDAAVQYLRGLTPDGRIFDFAKNLVNDREFAGATFARFGQDPDHRADERDDEDDDDEHEDESARGQTLFVNLQGDTRSTDTTEHLSYTFAIWGPWQRGTF